MPILCPNGRRGYETRQPLCTGIEADGEDVGLDQQRGGGKRCGDPGRNHKAFFAWFRVEVSPMVFDLAEDPIVLQPLNLTKQLDRE